MSIRRPLCHRFTMRRIPFFALLLLAGCASTGTTPAPIPTTHRTDAAGRYGGRDEVRTNAATGKPEVMHYDAKGKYIGISR
jgi:hypothetical protein